MQTPSSPRSLSAVLEFPADAPTTANELPKSKDILSEASQLDRTPLPQILKDTSEQLTGLAAGDIPEVLTATHSLLSEDITEAKLREILESFEKAQTQEEVRELAGGLDPEIASQVGNLLPPKHRINLIFQNLYAKQQPDGSYKLSQEEETLFSQFLNTLEQARKQAKKLPPIHENFHKDAIVYAVYVDLFNKNFKGMAERLDYLKDIGVTVIWLLPILSSPMYDAGFDIDDYHSIRKDLGNLQDFRDFLAQAHSRDIRVIFDVALNHTSFEHPWFKEAASNPNSPKRDYYIWSDDTQLYKEARIIFKGLCTSNWEKSGNSNYFHRFFPHQPDLNYKNPRVLLSVSRILVYWLLQDVDGFRADAIPYLWKEKGTTCENLPQTHSIVKFFRALLDFLRPGTIIVAEACQPPLEVVAYFGSNGDECQVAYHFPLMPRIFLSLSTMSSLPILNTLNTSFTPAILDNCQWFIFLRCHDELTLEMVTPEERELIHGFYCLQPQWDFRQGEGVSSRLSELFERDPRRVALAYSIMLTLLGTPIFFYGDEFGKLNDTQYYDEMFKITGIKDSRYLCRGRIDWQWLENELKNENSFHRIVFDDVKKRIRVRKQHPAFSRGVLKFVYVASAHTRKVNHSILAYLRMSGDDIVFVMHNLSHSHIDIIFKFKRFLDRTQSESVEDLLGQAMTFKKNERGDNIVSFAPYQHFWLKLNATDLDPVTPRAAV